MGLERPRTTESEKKATQAARQNEFTSTLLTCLTARGSDHVPSARFSSVQQQGAGLRDRRCSAVIADGPGLIFFRVVASQSGQAEAPHLLKSTHQLTKLFLFLF